MDPFQAERKKQNIDAWAEMKVKLSKCDFINWKIVGENSTNANSWNRLGICFALMSRKIKNKIAKQPTKRSLWCNSKLLKVSFRCAMRAGESCGWSSLLQIFYNGFIWGRRSALIKRKKLLFFKFLLSFQIKNFVKNLAWFEAYFLQYFKSIEKRASWDKIEDKIDNFFFNSD